MWSVLILIVGVRCSQFVWSQYQDCCFNKLQACNIDTLLHIVMHYTSEVKSQIEYLNIWFETLENRRHDKHEGIIWGKTYNADME